MFFAIAIPVRNASYSATLFVQVKVSLCEMVVVWSSGLVNTTPIPPVAIVAEPSKYNVQKSSNFVVTQVFSGSFLPRLPTPKGLLWPCRGDLDSQGFS
ncbi:hypothetical protein TIFTF001_023307 [Ficus carica]|uniref:Uncharacterized protein n=1 Tax=Ficus carica TaxID=3494 RepID=A0AA88ALK2_FICCA|nr:hypothetical protein TIFTF001_023307 [Ficus carica]